MQTQSGFNLMKMSTEVIYFVYVEDMQNYPWIASHYLIYAVLINTTYLHFETH